MKSRALMTRTIVISVVWIATALVYYGVIIALSDQSAPGRALFSGNFFVNNAIAGAIELPTLMVCVYLMRYGRKKSQMFTLIGAAVFIFAAMAAMQSKSQMVGWGGAGGAGCSCDTNEIAALPGTDAPRQDLHPGRLQHPIHLHLRALPHRHQEQCCRVLFNGGWIVLSGGAI